MIIKSISLFLICFVTTAAKLEIKVKGLRPPNLPKVRIHSTSKDSITWHIEESREQGDLPVLSYSISFAATHWRLLIPDSASTEEVVDLTSDQDEGDHHSEYRNYYFRKTPTNLYLIDRLIDKVEYQFTFYATNEVGNSNRIKLKASTGTNIVFSSASQLIISLPIFILSAALVLPFIQL